MTGYTIRDEDRLAVATIAGYRFQALHTIRAWLTINDDRFIVAEGNEDIDHICLGGLVREEQIKLLKSAIGQKDSSVIETVLNYLKAFVYHDTRGHRFVGMLRTTARIAQIPTTAIGRWIAGQKFLQRDFRKELEQHAKSVKDEDYTSELAYMRKRGKLTSFLKSVEWVGGDATPDRVENEIKQLLSMRASTVPTGLAYPALMTHLWQTLSDLDVTHRILRRIDVDLVLSDVALEHIRRVEVDEGVAPWTAALWTAQGSPSVAVVVLVRDFSALKNALEGHQQMDAAARRQRDIDTVLRDEIRRLDFIAYASRRMHSGNRGERVCAHDVVKQAKYRILPSKTIIATDAPAWLVDTVKARWPEPDRVSWTSSEGYLLRLSRIIAQAVVNDALESSLLESIESKLRWVHDIGAKRYFTIEDPLY